MVAVQYLYLVRSIDHLQVFLSKFVVGSNQILPLPFATKLFCFIGKHRNILHGKAEEGITK